MDYFDILLAKKLNGGGGGPIDLRTLTVTENGEQDAPSGVAYNKVITNVPAPSNAIYKQTLSNLPSPIATFTGADAPIDSLKASIVGVQDLHGYDSPWPAGGGKNKLPLTVANLKSRNIVGTWSGNTYSIANGTFEVLTDNADNVMGVKINGTFSGDVQFIIDDLSTLVSGTSYIATTGNNSASTSTFFINIIGIESFASSYTFTYDGTPRNIRIMVKSGVTVSNQIMYPMIRLSSVSDATFEPYSNICPISGWSGANIEDCGKNLVEQYAEWNITGEGEITVASGYTAIIAMVKAGQTYTISRNGTATIPNTMGFYYDKPQVGSISYNSERIIPNSATFIAPIDGFIVARMSTTSLTEYQIELGSTPTAYADYSGMNVYVSFGQDVYGGYLNVSTGVLTITHAKVTLDGINNVLSNASVSATFTQFEWAGYRTVGIENATFISDKLKFANRQEYSVYNSSTAVRCFIGLPNTITTSPEANEWLQSNNVDIVYPLATPITIQLTPMQVRTIQGNNNVFVDCGEVAELKYFSETP